MSGSADLNLLLVEGKVCHLRLAWDSLLRGCCTTGTLFRAKKVDFVDVSANQRVLELAEHHSEVAQGGGGGVVDEDGMR